MSPWTVLYNRRYRTGRKPEPEPVLDHSDLRRSRRRSNDRDHPHFPSHRATRTELEPVQLERTLSESREAIRNSGGVASSEGNRLRLRLISSNRLPGVVEQARARLLERLRGSSLSGRRETPVSPVVVDDAFTITESGEREAEPERQWSELVTLYGDLTIQMDQAPPFSDVIRRKTPPLCHAAESCLQREVFTNSEERAGLVRESLECCICLERFHEGDELILLHCAHRFHPACLEPWILTNGNCPYCRASTMC